MSITPEALNKFTVISPVIDGITMFMIVPSEYSVDKQFDTTDDALKYALSLYEKTDKSSLIMNHKGRVTNCYALPDDWKELIIDDRPEWR